MALTTPVHAQSHVLLVNTSKTTPVSVLLYNATGQLVAQLADREIVPSGVEKTLHWQVPAGEPDGFYYCTVHSDQYLRTSKLLKISR